MRKALGLFGLVAVCFAPVAAQAETGMAAMQYYVGTWSCVGGGGGEPPSNATATYTLDSGVLRDWVVVPPQGKMTTPYVLSIATTYDAKNGRYVQTGIGSDAGWWVSYAQPWTGNTEMWTDQANNTGKLGHGQNVRSDQNTVVINGYATLTATTPDFTVTCHRST